MAAELPATAHTDQPWLIHRIAPDFDVEDVWALPTPGGPHELPRLIDCFFASDFPDGAPLVVRGLWQARWLLGRIFRWDRPESGLGKRVPSLRDRLPAELRQPPDRDLARFTELYSLENEWAGEIANDTVHAVLHLGWVPTGSGGGYRGQLAVLVRPNGPLGAAYMAGIRPFRHLLVYPALLANLERSWRAGAPV